MSSVAGDLLVVELPVSAFSIEAAKRAAYTLMAKLDVEFDIDADTIRCVLRPASSGIDLELAARDFRREVLDQDLRLLLERNTAPYRDAILGLAFSKTGLQDG